MTGGLSRWLQLALVSSRGVWKALAVTGLCLVVGVGAGALLALLTPVYMAALIVALAACFLLLRDVQWALFAMFGLICLLPFAAVPLGVGFEPTFLDLVLMALLFVWACRIATRRQGPFVATPLAVPILAFLVLLIAAFVAGLAHSSLSTTLVRRFAELLLGIVSFFAVVNNVHTRQRLERVVTVLMLAGFAAALIGIVLYVLPANLAIRLLSLLRFVRYPAGSGVLRYIEDDPQLPLRAISTSQDPNVLGGLLIIVTALTMPQLVSQRPLIPRKLVLAMTCCMVLCLILTFSRGAMFGLAVGVASVAVLRYRRLAWLLLFGALLLLVLPQAQIYVQRFIEGVHGQDLATQMRFGEYKDAITVILRHPWLGVGFSATPEIYLYVGVSNVYLLIAEESGIIGLGLFLIIMALLFAQLWRGAKSARHDPGLEALLWGFWGAILGALAGGLFDHYFFNLAFSHAITLFWSCMGLAMATVRLATDPDIQGAHSEGSSH